MKRCFRGNACRLALWLSLTMAACSGTPPASVTRSAGGSAGQPAASPAAETPPAPDGGAPAPATAGQAEKSAFSTRYAHFQPASWNQLPGWQEDRLADAWAAFRRSCGALGRKPGWDGPCERSARVAASSDEAIHQFFEREFALYEIRNTDRSPEGVITGYYEPLINGSRSQNGPFVYPVYGAPDDLLTLDIRQLPKSQRGQPVPGRIVGRTVVAEPGGNAPYLIDVGEMQADVRDKKLRVRLDGNRIVPYPTRAEIERDGLPRARVLVWVDNPAAFYSMQIQGSGKVRLQDGKVVRLAYAEQNGHPFKPPQSRAGSGGKKSAVTTRGLNIELPEAEDDPADPASESAAEPLTRGLKQAAAPRPLPRANEPLAPDVERLVEELSRNAPAAGRPSAANPRQPAPRAVAPPTAARVAASPPAARVAAASPAAQSFPQPRPEMLSAISADPSYVFFREIPDGPEGPIGALGVPLTAGRSVAVDPRTTPLGYPVFVSTSQPGRKGKLNRLVMAQDTGGAIRGAVRADYFWGFGADAYAQAARMKESGRMWLMLPHGQQIAARDQATRTRGVGSSAPTAECLVADPDLCVEDR
jgi:membrane-bound lytic murein transglycosylase A